MKISIYFIIFLAIKFSTSANAQVNHDVLNQKVCNRFEVDLNRLAAIMEELKMRKGITETRVAFGGVDTPIKSADYQITYAAEAMAFQRAQKYSSKERLKSDLGVLAGKVLRAKTAVGKALSADE